MFRLKPANPSQQLNQHQESQLSQQLARQKHILIPHQQQPILTNRHYLQTNTTTMGINITTTIFLQPTNPHIITPMPIT